MIEWLVILGEEAHRPRHVRKKDGENNYEFKKMQFW